MRPALASPSLQGILRPGDTVARCDRSSLAVLSSHPFDAVKIVATTPTRTLAAILAATRALDLSPVTKAVEETVQLGAVGGCDAVQGFAIVAPGPADTITRSLAADAQ